MKVLAFVNAVHRAYTGKAAVVAPAVGTPKRLLYLETAMGILETWATDPDNNWKTNFREATVDVVAGIGVLPDDFARFADALDSNNKLSGIKFTSSAGVVSYLEEIEARDRNIKTGLYLGDVEPTAVVLTSGGSGTLVFGYHYIPTLTDNNTFQVVCDSAEWLVHETAATLADANPAQEDRAPALQAKANLLYTRMVRAAIKGARGIQRSMPSRMPRIGRSW